MLVHPVSELGIFETVQTEAFNGNGWQVLGLEWALLFDFAFYNTYINQALIFLNSLKHITHNALIKSAK